MQSDQHGVIEEQHRKAMSAQDERTWSILAHLSMFLNLITGFLGPLLRSSSGSSAETARQE